MLKGILGIGTTVLDELAGASSLEGAFLSDEGPLALPLTFIRVLDPFADGAPFRPVLEKVLELFQDVIAAFMFGEDGGELPSKRNEVLNLKERRDGTIYLASGCDAGECRHASSAKLTYFASHIFCRN